MDRNERNAEIDFLKECFTSAQIAFCTNYIGLTVPQVTELRRNLRQSGAKARVVKNTLGRIGLKKALGESANAAELTKFEGLLKGPSLVIFASGDPVAPAKVLAKYCKDNEKFKMKGALFEGRYVDSAGVDSLSKMPGRNELMAQLLRVILAPATQVVQILAAPAGQVVRVIDAQRRKIEGGSAAA